MKERGRILGSTNFYLSMLYQSSRSKEKKNILLLWLTGYLSILFSTISFGDDYLPTLSCVSSFGLSYLARSLDSCSIDLINSITCTTQLFLKREWNLLSIVPIFDICKILRLSKSNTMKPNKCEFLDC